MKRILILLSVLSFFTLNTGYVEAGGGKAPAPPPLAISPSTKDVFYVNQKIKFSASGGTTPYSFTSSFGAINKTSGDYTAPSVAGTARVTVTDKKGNTATYNAPVYFYLSINPAASSVPTSSNYSFAGAGGLAPYKYSTNNGTVGASNGVFSAPGTPGTAIITVTDSRNNKATSNVTIYQSLGITPTTNLIMVNKTFTFKGTGGMGSYTYSTDKGSIASTGVYTAPGTSGPAVVTVTDTRNAKATAAVTIYPELIISPTSLTMVVNKSSTFTALGGYGARTFSTNNGSIGASSGVFVAPPISGSAIITVTDSLGNKATANVAINADLSISPTNLFLAINKPANFIGSGGIAPLTFSSTYGNINSSSGAYTAPAAGGLGTITVTDNSNPRLSKSASICVFAPLKVSPEEKTIVVGGSTVISAIDGCAPYEYTADIGTISTNKNVNNNTGNYKAPNTEGNAKITIKDAAGNTVVANIRINNALAMEPLPLTLPINGIYTVRPSAGVPPYIFRVTNGIGSINPDGKYTAPGTEGTANITVTDGDGMVRSGQICVYEPLKISPAEKSLVINSTLSFSATHGCKPYKFSTNNGSINIDSGSYTAPAIAGLGTVTVTDLANKNSVANLTIYPPISLNPMLGKLQTGKTLKFTAKGGVPALTWESNIGNISLSPGNINPLSVEGITDVTTIITYTAPNTPGIANIKVTDSMSFNQAAIIEIYAPLEITPADKTLMVNDKFTFSVSGGVPPYTYESTIGIIATTKSVNNNTGFYIAPGNAGVGKVTVKDSDGNQVSANVTINPALSLSPTVANLEVNQLLHFVASGGIGPYRFISSMDSRDFDLAGNFRPIKSGIATITLQDSAGHEVTANVKVYDPLDIIPHDKVLAVGDSFDRFTAKGGIPNYGFSQSIGMVDPISGIYTAPLGGPGTGYVEVRDSIGNTKQAQITINPALSLVAEKENVEVGKTSKFTASGGIGNLTFSTEAGRGQIGPSGNYIAPSTKGPATITVVDTVGHSKSVTINIYDPLNISPPQKVLVLDDSFQFNISGGVLPYTVTAITGRPEFVGYYTARVTGEDTITVVDSIGNTVAASVTVNAKLAVSPLTANLEVNKSMLFVVTGGIGPYRYASSMDMRDFDLNGNFRPIKSGTAKLTFTDSTGRFVEAEVKVYDPLNISPTSKDLAVGNSFPFLITGGALPYKKVEADRGNINEFGNYTAPSEVGNGTDKITVIDHENNVVTANLNIKAGLKIDPASAILAVNRTIIFKAVDGVGPYTFSVNNIGTIGLTTGSYQAPNASGTAEVTVRDSLGNTATAIVTINEDLDINPKDIKLAVGKTRSFSASGGVDVRRFSALRGQIDPVTGAYVAPQSVGEDTVTVTDGAGFTKTAKVTVYDTLKISPAIKELAVSDPFKFTITGGFPGLTANAARGTINVNGDYVAPSEVGDGEDTITVNDSDNNTVTAKVVINSALAISPTTANLEILKKLDFTVSGGIGPFTYVTTIGTIVSNKSTKNNLGFYSAPGTKGTATITVTDNLGHRVTAEVNVYDPIKISPTSKLLAFGNKFDFTGSGGVPPYTFSFETKIGDITTDGNLGKYSAPTDNPGTGVILLTDSIGNFVKANISINTSLAVNAPNALPVGGNLDFANLVTGGIPGYSYGSPSIGTIAPDGKYQAPADGGSEEITITDSDGVKVVAKFCVFKPLAISPNSKILAVKDTETFEAQEGCKPYRFEVAGGIFDFVAGANSGLFRAPESAGIGTVKVIDNVGHNVTANITINPGLAITPETANLEVNKKLSFTVSGGIAPYTYESSIGSIATSKSVNNIIGNYSAPATKGTATITVTDNVGHKITAEVNVYDSLKITPIQKNIAVGDTVDYVIEGGFGSLSIVPVGGSIDENRKYTAITAGNGSVTVTDSDDNTVVANLTISAALSLDPTVAKVEVGKTLKFNASGGVGNLSFSALAGRGEINSSGDYLAPATIGPDTVTVSDTANHSLTAEVTVYDTLRISPEQKDLAVNNTFNFIITGGFGPYTIAKAERGSFNANGNYIAPDSAGEDKITVTDSDNNTVFATLNIKPALRIDPSSATLAVNRNKTFRGIDGVGPYTFTVNNVGEIGLTTGAYQAPAAPGVAEVTVTDSLLNTATAVVTINPELVIDPENINLAVNGNKKFNASGGVGNLTFTISNGTGDIVVDGTYTAPSTKGLVQVTVTDSEGFFKTANVNVYLPLNIDPTEKILAVGNHFDFSAIEGVPPYVFSVDSTIGSITTSNLLVINAGVASLTAAGSDLPVVGYVKLKDTANPDNQVSAKVTVNEPLSLDPKPSFLAINGTYDFKASTKGGAPDYTYSADNGSFINGIYTASGTSGTALITVRDSMGGEATASLCIYAPLEFDPNEDKVLAVENTFTFKAKEGCAPYKFASSIGSIGIDSGTFSSAITGSGQITVTDATNVNTARINITIAPPLAIEPTVANLEVGKNKDFTASGGVFPYEFSLLTATGMGSISSGASTVNYVAPLTGGSNTVRVTDSFGNTKDAVVTIYNSLAISPSERQEIEAGKPAITFTASGGISPYVFTLTNAVGTITTSGATGSYNPGATKGVTKVILTDKENNTKEVDINVYLPLILSPATNQTIGKNDRINFTASEGLPGYTWSVSPSSASLIVSADKTTAEFSAPDITQLTSYVVTVVDSGGTSRSTNVAVSLPLIISPKTLSIAVKGSSSFSATGGYQPYKFTTTIGAIDQLIGEFNALNISGTGKVTVTDAAGLTDFANVTVIPGLTIMPNQASVQINGSYDFLLSGGIPPYFHSADKGSTINRTGGFTYTALGTAGDAVVTARDSSTPPNEVSANVKIYAGLGIDPAFRTLGLDETATFKGTGGVPNYVFSAEFGRIATDPAGDGGKGVGNYVFSQMVLMDTITVRDNTGATAQAFVNGNFPSLFVWAFGSDAFNTNGTQGANAGPPGARAITANWSDDNGNLWLLGGLGLSPTGARIVLFSFQRYDTKINKWFTYESSARNAGKYGTKGTADTGNYAGARYGSVGWTTDGGKTLWLFGGHGYADANNALGELNDLWKINVANIDAGLPPRTWISGSDKINQQGNYGSGVACPSGLATGAPPSATTVPGARSKAVSWKDPQGNFWLFGGKGYDCAGTLGYLNDLWKYTVSNNQWTWVGGSNKVGSPGQFTNGTDGTFANPGAREGAVSWVDVNGDFWLFGGSSSPTNFLNGLWKFNRTTNRWAFVKGPTVANQFGIYGNKAEGYPLNNPGSRDGAIGFADSKGNLFLFGGYGYGESGSIGYLNDYWSFNTLSGSNNWVWEAGDKTINGLGSHGQIEVPSPNSWPGARSFPAFWKDSNGKFWFFGGARTRNIEDAPTGDFYNDMWKFFPK